MNEMQVFSYEGSEVRTVQIESETWWVLKDVCDVLGIKNASQLADRLDDDERAMFNIGRQGETNIINESGLYNVILRSDKPEAKKFKRWVTGEVLPSIRRTGGYQARPMTQAEILAGMAQHNVEMERKVAVLETKTEATEHKLTAALDALAAPSPESWKEDMNRIINGMCQENELNFMKFKRQLYDELERVAVCDLHMRRCRLKARLEKAGATYKERESVSKLDIVDRDPKLRAIFEGIVRRQQALHAKTA